MRGMVLSDKIDAQPIHRLFHENMEEDKKPAELVLLGYLTHKSIILLGTAGCDQSKLSGIMEPL